MNTYTPEEIKAIIAAPMNVGMAVAMVDMGIISTAIEIAAMAKEMAGAAKQYPHNTIIQAAFSEDSLKQTQLDKPEIKPEDVQSGAFIDQAIAQANQVVASLQSQATETEITEYKQFIYDCGNAVAKAAGSGLFGSGAKVSQAEAETLARLKLALGL
jgi:hypothetical protein